VVREEAEMQAERELQELNLDAVLWETAPGHADAGTGAAAVMASMGSWHSPSGLALALVALL
jgi:hypothetical protein